LKHFSFFIFYAILIFAITGCLRKIELPKDELKLMDLYKVGDTLVFKSDKGHYDTSIIIKEEIFYEDYEAPFEDKYLSQIGVIWYKNTKLKDDPNGRQLIRLEKKTPAKTLLVISYLYSDIFILDFRSSDLKPNSTYDFMTHQANNNSDNPKKIYWSTENGIVGYVTNDQVVWRRVN
jgi:hypothetical protein